MPLSILLVEKDALTRETIVYMLEALKYKVHAVANAEMASRVLRSTFFDVAILSLDRFDPGSDALAMAAKTIQRDLRMIVVSGRHPPAAMLPCVDAFVQKPFSLKAIDDAIARLGLPALPVLSRAEPH